MARKRKASVSVGANPGNGGIVGDGNLRGYPRLGTAIISGATFTNKSVAYYDIEGVAILEGNSAEVPFEIDHALPNQQRVTDAIAHWEANTHPSSMGRE